MKTKITIFFLVISAIVFGQESRKDTKTITCSGKSQTFIRPDIVTLSITIEKSDTSETNVIKRLNIESNSLIDLMVKLGVPKDKIKLAEYNISINDSYEEKKRLYNGIGSLYIKTNYNKDLMEQVINGIRQNKNRDFSFTTNFKLSNDLEQKTRDGLIIDAINKAQRMGEGIAIALKVKIKGVYSISKNDYIMQGDANLTVSETVKYSKLNSVADRETSSPFSKIDPNDIELNEDIVIVYEIE